MVKKEKPSYSIISNVSFMIKQAWHINKLVLVFCLLPSLVMVGLDLLELYITPIILQKVTQAVPVYELIHTILFFTIGLMGLQALTAYLEMITLLGRVNVRLGIVDLLNEKVVSMSYPLTEDTKMSQKLAKASEILMGNNMAGEAIWQTLSDLLKNMLGFVIYLMILSRLPVFLILIVLGTSLTGYFVSRRCSMWVHENREKAAEYDNTLWYLNQKMEGISFSKDLRMFGIHNWLDEMYQKSLCLYAGFCKQRERVNLKADIMDVILTFMRNGVAYAYLISKTIAGEYNAAEFLLLFTAVSGFTVWVKGNLETFIRLHKQSLELCALREALDYPEQFQFENGEKIQAAPDMKCEFCLRNVSFRYPGAKKETISHLNLKLKAGEKIAIVGANGAGKTTLIKLLCGFYDPTEGEILLNGKPVKGFDRRDYYSLFTAVFQEYSVLEATLNENVAVSVDGIDEDKVKDCIAKAGLAQVAEELPNGYQTYIGREVFLEGTEFSGGQMQRMMLARALYKNAPVIILDEPTAALDPLAEADLYERYHELTQGRTSVYISHRLASTRFCDRVLYMEDGQILEEGTHEELLFKKGKYAEMFEIQSRYYREGRAF